MSGIEWLASLEDEASFTPGDRTLDTIRALLAALGHPERAFRVIHLTGTAGKGSVAEFITRILIASGYRVGTYGSPHVYRLNERIRIDGEEVSSERLDQTLRQLHERSDEAGVVPRWFEALTAAAFVIFRDENVPWAVVEVGLGGRLDSTNVFDPPQLTIVTSIGLDHQAFLGETEADIARDKAGIFRPGVPALIGEVSDEARLAIVDEAARIGAPVIQIQDLDARLPTEPSLFGPHQQRNAALAVGALSVIASKAKQSSRESLHERLPRSRCSLAMTITREAIITGLRSAHLPGRFEILSKDPLVIFDVAHNPMKVAALVETIEELPANWKHPEGESGQLHPPGAVDSQRFTTVVGIKRDKDAATMLRLLDRVTARYLFVDLPDVPHWSPAELAHLTHKPSKIFARSQEPRRFLQSLTSEVRGTCENPTSAFDLDLAPRSPLLITGSFHLAKIVNDWLGRASRSDDSGTTLSSGE